MQAAQPQLNLKDIHLPDSVSVWPPALGYWLILFVIVLCIISYFWIKAYRSKRLIKKLALKEFSCIKKQYQSQADKKPLVSALSVLLRRAAISSYPRSDCASLTGNDWLLWLDQTLKNTRTNFSSGPGYLLTEFNYSESESAEEIDDLLYLTHAWLKQLPVSDKTILRVSK